MSVEYWVLLLVVWIVCGHVAYGITYGFFQREFPLLADELRWAARLAAGVICVTGPIGMVVSTIMSGFGKHGLKWK